MSLILAAIVESVERAEQAEAFDALADARWSMLAATGETVAWDDAKAWLEARARGETPPRPAARQVGV